MIAPISHVAVVIPAANEQDTIADCLRGITVAVAQAQAARPELTAHIVVVLDRCTDRTAEIAQVWPGVHGLPSDAGRVGVAREHGSRWAAEHAPVVPARTWTAHTDADSVVPAHWLAHQLEHADRGAALVLGTVRPELDENTLVGWLQRYDERDGHPHVHGANLGIRADVLAALGGWGEGREHEDAELVVRAERAGYRIVRTGSSAVVTSGRRVGRTPGGLAGYLRDLGRELNA